MAVVVACSVPSCTLTGESMEVQADAVSGVVVVVCVQVIDEVTGGLEGWASKNRWEDLGIVQQLQQHPELQWAY